MRRQSNRTNFPFEIFAIADALEVPVSIPQLFFPLSSSSSRRLIFMFIACAKKNPYRNRFMPLHDSPYERESEKNASICEKGKNENLSHKGIIMRALEAFSKIGIIKF